MLGTGLAGAGALPGPQAQRNDSLADPDLDVVGLARGLGVPAVRSDDAEAFSDAFGGAMHEPGPHLIEVPL